MRPVTAESPHLLAEIVRNAHDQPAVGLDLSPQAKPGLLFHRPAPLSAVALRHRQRRGRGRRPLEFDADDGVQLDRIRRHPVLAMGEIEKAETGCALPNGGGQGGVSTQGLRTG
jgi:hypothetical protein